MTSPQQRAAGALYGLAVGDALGMPTESLPRAEIVVRYGPLVDSFRPGPPDQPLAAGLPAGTVTDDTEQALLLAGLVIEGAGVVDETEFARRLIGWEEKMRARGSLSLLGPSTKRALAALLAGADVAEAGRFGTTNGAAMRITPVGIATPCDDLGLLVHRVVAASRVTHHTGVALAAAAAVAAAVSAGVAGASVPEATSVAVAAAGQAAGRGYWVAAADVAARIGWAAGLTAGLAPQAAIDAVYTLVGTSLASQESVPSGVRDPGRRPGRSLAGLPDGRVGGRGHRQHRRDGRGDGRGLPRGGRDPRAGPGYRQRRERAAAGRGGRRAAGGARPVTGPSVTGRSIQRLLHLGNVVVDIVLDLPALPDRGGDVLASHTELAPGGGFNVMAAAARQGLPVAHAGPLGHGPLADRARQGLAAEGIEVLLPSRPDLDTGFVVTMVEPTGERTFLTSPGAEATLTTADLAGVMAGPADAVHLSGYGLVHPANREALTGWLAGLADGNLVTFDPGPLVRSIPRDVLAAVLSRADWLTCNAREAAQLSGQPDPAAALRALTGHPALDGPARPGRAGPGRSGRLPAGTFPNGTDRGRRIPGYRARYQRSR